jgi:hypothetical protein
MVMGALIAVTVTGLAGCAHGTGALITGRADTRREEYPHNWEWLRRRLEAGPPRIFVGVAGCATFQCSGESFDRIRPR